MILVHQRYFANPGKEDATMEVRLRASERLRELNVPVGTIWVPADADPQLPTLIWECAYESAEARERIRAFQESDAKFHAIRTGQRANLRDWVREHYRLVDLDEGLAKLGECGR
jgi:hypothetical protein